jgi:hypothetical protein
VPGLSPARKHCSICAPPRGVMLVPVRISLLLTILGAASLEGLQPPAFHSPDQAVEGVLLDASDGAPVPQGRVRLLDGEGGTVATAFSDEDGRFRLEVPRAGTWRLEAQRIGYETAERAIHLAAGEVARIEWRLTPSAILLDPLVAQVRGAARPPRCVPQLVLGLVLDGPTGEPIGGARMELLGHEGRPVHSATTGDDGRFALVTPGPGLYRIRGAAEGYPAAEGSDLPILPGDTIQVEFRLEAAAAHGTTGAMVVTGSTRPWADRQAIAHPERFFARMRGCQDEIPQGARFGSFVDRNTIRDWEHRTYQGAVGAMLVRETPHVWDYSWQGSIYMASPRGRCSATVFVDGRLLLGIPPLDFLEPRDLEGIEVYRNPHVPREYWADGEQPCGVLLFWTRNDTEPGLSSARRARPWPRILAGFGAAFVALYMTVF